MTVRYHKLKGERLIAHCVPEALEDPNTNIFRLVYGSTDVAYGLGTGKVSERSAYVCVSNVDLSD